ncbi:Protein CBR-UGT-37 [Caenorhabditis briggsae]|uniref:glucuronosyltransferase n=2 Tax=Caenorhabditis briggsae TaxID=6238 RepID=A0AAE9F5P9_CAEBR|nr:Protein CBR-UGT-37 [Caenorhabditis briggsae]ULT90490.1 hypothetical protein L3Y34_008670 [Caenorhabditis briggsae]UMM36272.1 hypothetical protein L5515_008511 [Caenorhabditis briggsae]CAP36394.1 Protein CBR-UGT-37 [Caenorhabditis briggsae]
MKLTVLLFSFVQLTFSYNFLVFCPLFGHSHTTYFAKIADTLTDAGHNVTFFTPTIIQRFAKHIYVKSTKNVIHLEPSEKLAILGDKFEEGDTSKFWTSDSTVFEMLPMIDTFNRAFEEQTVVLGRNLELLDELKAKNFDAMIFESFVDPAYPLLDYLQIKTILPATSIAFDEMLSHSIGEPIMTSAVPAPMSAFTDQMTFMERIINTITSPIMYLIMPKRKFKSLRFPHSTIEISSQESMSSFVFTNSNPYLDYARPTIEKNVQIGGISVDVDQLKSQKVNKEWDEILNLRTKTILVSFGSIMLSKDMPLENRIALASTMKQFPEVTFIWKYESNDTDSFAKGIENIHFSNWIPQTALLADFRLSAFFTHAGLGSINEVSYLGKPTILCPIFADQMRNAQMLARHNGSVEISKYELGQSQKLQEVFKKILYDQSYTTASENLALQLANQPVKPRELLVRHAEFAAKFGRLPSLDPYSRHMSFVSYFLIDVAATIFLISLLVFYVFFRIAKRLINYLPITLTPVKHKTN